MTRQVFYLHGFTSSAQSTKARFFRERFRALGIDLHCPDFNEPDFGTLTITRMLDQVSNLVEERPPGAVALIGSSLGAFVAVEAAARSSAARAVDRLVLLAPALDFSLANDKTITPSDLQTWRTTGTLDIFHYHYGATRPLAYEFYRDAQRYQPLHTDLRIPMLVFQGTRDDVVDPESVRRFASQRPNVTLRMLDDGHQLLDHLDLLWNETATFLDLR
jgi:pimeloyl-ACP methyl ester carboxylesterase